MKDNMADTINVYTCLYEKGKTAKFDRKEFSQDCGAVSNNTIHKGVLDALEKAQTVNEGVVTLKNSQFFEACGALFNSFVYDTEYRARKTNPCNPDPSETYNDAKTMATTYCETASLPSFCALRDQADADYAADVTFDIDCAYSNSMKALKELRGRLNELNRDLCKEPETTQNVSSLAKTAKSLHNAFISIGCKDSLPMYEEHCQSLDTSLANVFDSYKVLKEYECTGLTALSTFEQTEL